jgi:hypothetical protein
MDKINIPKADFIIGSDFTNFFAGKKLKVIYGPERNGIRITIGYVDTESPDYELFVNKLNS